ncbi:telomerase protein component 1-like [Cheilinus undulatus]|uniref:telomerase protein component 1-like n=1 Tax=Cheilinus undulatus TaxID=241271 RepID=UPI001BD258B0|nr:telomerase protein component 1-like [Cheilinus undulatus]
MKSLTLQQADVAQGGHQQTCGRSLTSNYAPPSLENKLLTQTSALLPPLSNLALQPSSCPALQPSHLSSTSSSLLSTSFFSPSFTSPLLSTENKLLKSQSPLPSSSLTSFLSGPKDSLLQTSHPSCPVAHPPSLITGVLGGEEKSEDGGDEGKEETSEMMPFPFEDTSLTHSEEESSSEEEYGEEDDVGSPMEIAVLGTDLGNQELDQDLVIKQEEFTIVERGNEETEEKLKDKKYRLLNAVCCSLISKSTNPGESAWNAEHGVWTRIMNLAKDISVSDPQFLLKVAVYTRQELNIRITANFLLALAASLPSTKLHFRRYFCSAVQLPSDWLEVVRIYSKCFSHSLPMCLKNAMADKFKQFNEYQLAKYNTRKHRCKHSRNRPKAKKPTAQQLHHWASLLRSNKTILEKFLQVEGSKADSKVVVDKKQSEFSIKKMIKRLHIKEPAEHVMAILGKKYPADPKTFMSSGIKGVWDRERAGQRMKLKEPETWERLLSLEGNKAATWEKLIDNKSLPFMAMLRNLRNMIIKGISKAHHEKILNRLTNKKAVIESRQFPFRFLTAYKVILQLRTLASAAQQAIPPVHEILKDILRKIPKSKQFRRMDWESTERSRIRVTRGVPFLYRQYRLRKAQLIKANERLFSVELLDRYCRALETAVQISCRYNIPPLPGRTVILLNAHMNTNVDLKGDQDFCLPPDPDQEEEEEETEEVSERRRKKKKQDENLTPSAEEIGVLLSLMICSSAEDAQLGLFNWYTTKEVKLQSDVLLENVRAVMKQIKVFGESSPTTDRNFHSKVLTSKNKPDNIIIVTDYWVNSEIQWYMKCYRKEVNNKALLVKISFAERYKEFSPDRNIVNLDGFSEQMLRFVAERGSFRLLDHVEHIDKLYNIPALKGAKGPQASDNIVPVPPSPRLRWQSIRVFISSTFRDMHAERDILVRSVFPELRRRAAQHCLYLQEVELRWGVTEEESERAAELCLSEVCRSQMMVGILGERYGLVPPKPDLPDLPQYSWLSSAPAGLSISEMEIRQFKALYPDNANQRMFCYFRDPNITKSVPVAWRSHFAPESKEAESKMSSLKKMIRDSKVKVMEDYPCEWGGIVEGKPYLKNLEDFGKAVLEDLWTAILKQFVNEKKDAEAVSEMKEQEVHQGALQRQFFGRQKLLTAAVEMVEQVRTKGGMMVVEGGPGEGKTIFMAALAQTLRTGEKSKKNLTCDVISYSTAASQSAKSVENLLQCLVQWLKKKKETKEEGTPLASSYKDLLSEFHSSLNDMEKKTPLVLLVDGVDLVQDGRGQLCSDWIPQQLPQNVCLVVSITSKAALLQTLAKKRGSILFTLGQLTMLDRKEIVQKGLDSFGKRLSDSAFNNQLQILVMKKGAVSPLYLQLACEDLRNFASFDKLKESLQDLPQSLSQLVQYSLDRLCSQYRGMLGLRWALAALTVSTTGLREKDFCSVLNTCNELSSGDGQAAWKEVLHLSRSPKGRIPMATFTRVVQSLQSLMGSSHCHNTDDLLALTNSEVKRAFEDFLLPTESDRAKAHLVLAAHLWALADPQGSNTFLHCEANSVMHLPSSLIQSGQVEALQSLLSSYFFLYAQVRHGLLHQLLKTYSLCVGSQESLEDCRSFLKRHAQLLSSWPTLFIQQALNEPPETSAHIWAQGLMGKEGVRVVKCLNNDGQVQHGSSELVSTFSSEPTCLVMSPDKELMVVGTGQGTLHVINIETKQEVKSLVSSCDGISSCVFLKDGRLATTSYDGQIEIWDIGSSCRTALIDAHTNTITASDITADKKNLATVSLDFKLKVWSSAKGNEVAVFHSQSPLNCVNFDPEGHLLAAGCWNGNVIIWNWLRNKVITSLSGHKRSVRSLSFAPSSSSMLCSGSVCGEVRVWSVPTSTCVGCFQAHSGATEALTFLERGSMLLSAGSDNMLQLWSGGLGRSVAVLKDDVCEQEPPPKKQKPVLPAPAALCVAVNGDFAVVGYHSDGIKLFNLETGEKIWQPDFLNVTVLSMRWVYVKTELTETELLVTAGSDIRLRIWKKKDEELGLLGGLYEFGLFACQRCVLAIEQNSTYLATASVDSTICLWSLSELVEDPCTEPQAVLNGHTGGVTCMSFSPDGGKLLSGGKDKTLIVWDVSASPPVLSKSLRHSHRDWITGCVWTPECVVSSSTDGRLCFWDLQAGQRLKEISWTSPLTSVCCLGQYVIAGCAEGALHVWNGETNTEVSHIAAHEQQIDHCCVLTHTDKNKEVKPEEMTVLTASKDGTVKLWKPLEVEHFNTFHGHSGSIHGVVLKEGLPEFLTFSEDCSLRSWTLTSKGHTSQRGPVTALCFSDRDDLLLVGYESGYLEIWQNNTVVGHKQTSSSSITAICSMPDNQYAVGYTDVVVDVWKLVWNEQRCTANLVKVKSYNIEGHVIHLMYCSVLMAVSHDAAVFDVAPHENRWFHTCSGWSHHVQVMEMIRNDEKSLWLVGEVDGQVAIGFIFAMGPNQNFSSSFATMTLITDEEEKTEAVISAATMDGDFVVVGDTKGNMWFIRAEEPSTWRSRIPAHSDRISVLRLTDITIISASYDRTVKLWDRNTKKQVGMFVCGAPVLHLEVNPKNPTELVCGDAQGKLYILSWKG